MKAAVICAMVLLGTAACGEVGEGPGVEPVPAGATTDETGPPPDTASATAAPTEPSAPPTERATTDPVATSSTSVGVVPGLTASSALAAFLSEVDALTAEAPPLLAQIQVEGAAGTVDEALLADADALGARFFVLTDLVPPGLHPDVQDAVEDVLFDLGDVMAPLTSAWGWEPSTLGDDFGEQMSLGAGRLPQDRTRVDDAAAAFPDVMAVDPASRLAAEHAVFALVLGRGLGHQNFLTGPDWSVRWVGTLPPAEDPYGCTGPLLGEGSFEGDFVAGSGGCSIVLYDTRDPYSREAEVQAFLADPAGTPLPDAAEIVTVRFIGDRWEVAGSVE